VSPFIPAGGPSRENPPYTNIGSGFARKAARSRHTGGVNVVMADASLTFVSDDISLAT
jgi:prepilin-type processing-associated H-X9-DG protein